jgi:hypothetical protein
VALPVSAAWATVKELCDQGFRQKDFVRAVRGPLFGTTDPRWLPVFRRMDFQRLAKSTREVSNAGEKLGRSVEMAAQSADGEIPESMTFVLPVFTLQELRARELRVAIEVDVDTERIRGGRIGDDFDAAFQAARYEIVEWLRDNVGEHITVLAGTM